MSLTMDVINEISLLVSLIWIMICFLIMIRAIISDFCSKKKKNE